VILHKHAVQLATRTHSSAAGRSSYGRPSAVEPPESALPVLIKEMGATMSRSAAGLAGVLSIWIPRRHGPPCGDSQRTKLVDALFCRDRQHLLDAGANCVRRGGFGLFEAAHGRGCARRPQIG
jgi:hypothetical protein